MRFSYALTAVLYVTMTSLYGQSNATIVHWKFQGESGISTRNGVITQWPEARLGPKPTQVDIDSWQSEYQVWRDAQEVQRNIDGTDPEIMARWTEQLTVLLIERGLIAKTDLPVEVLDTINARRVLRGEAVLP